MIQIRLVMGAGSLVAPGHDGSAKAKLPAFSRIPGQFPGCFQKVGSFRYTQTASLAHSPPEVRFFSGGGRGPRACRNSDFAPALAPRRKRLHNSETGFLPKTRFLVLPKPGF
jgi:hypothetical protein